MRPVAIFGGALGQVVDEGFDLISAGISQGGGAAVIGGIGLHEAGIEVVLADQQAEAVAEARLAVVVAVISVRGSACADRAVRARWIWGPSRVPRPSRARCRRPCGGRG